MPDGGFGPTSLTQSIWTSAVSLVGASEVLNQLTAQAEPHSTGV